MDTQNEIFEEEVEQTYIPRKPRKKTGLIIAIAVAVVAIAAFLVLYFMVLKPNSIYKKAVAALEASDFALCQQLIDSIPDHEGTPALQEKKTLKYARALIEAGDLDKAEALLLTVAGVPEAKELTDASTYKRAANALAEKKLEDAHKYLDMIPEHEDPDNLRGWLKYEDAGVALNAGDYETAYTLYGELADYEDAATLYETAFYEALTFKCLFDVRNVLRLPASMRISEVNFYRDEQENLGFVAKITATNTYGETVEIYAYDKNLNDGTEDANLLELTSYKKPGTDLEKKEKTAIDEISAQTASQLPVDLERMNRLLAEGVTPKIGLPFVTQTPTEG